jgi:hypothetical protein
MVNVELKRLLKDNNVKLKFCSNKKISPKNITFNVDLPFFTCRDFAAVAVPEKSVRKKFENNFVGRSTTQTDLLQPTESL